LAAGAEIMFGYPITPSTEILEGWIKNTLVDRTKKYLQTEDETAADFATIGAILAGAKAFTATAGPGHILMQDPLSMAENLRIPFVTIVMQRGGPSTGTVNFSQQEVNLAAFGGNGDGLRVVYSASSVQDMYDLTIKAFSTAWKYRFPTFVLGDGHIGKMRIKAKIVDPIRPVKAEPLLKEGVNPSFLRNCYSSETAFGDVLLKNIADWKEARPKIEEHEVYRVNDAKELIIAHGSVAQASKDACDLLRNRKKKIGLFRPITLNPFPSALKKIAKKAKKIYIVESSLNQFSKIIKYELYGYKNEIIEISKPAVGFTGDEIARKILVS
jgi:2-oxoglutarate ferredoxin oxidoreductase subunit alpha